MIGARRWQRLASRKDLRNGTYPRKLLTTMGAIEVDSALVAYGIGRDGKRQLLAVTIGTEESEGSWSEQLAQLIERGLAGVQLVIADAHLGFSAAVRKYLPEVPQQRCTVHLQRNVLTKAPQRLRSRLGKAVTQVFEVPSKVEARKRMEALAAGLGRQVPEAMECLRAGFEAATQFYAFQREHWHRIRSTNGLERLHGEIKRRTRDGIRGWPAAPGRCLRA